MIIWILTKGQKLFNVVRALCFVDLMKIYTLEKLLCLSALITLFAVAVAVESAGTTTPENLPIGIIVTPGELSPQESTSSDLVIDATGNRTIEQTIELLANQTDLMSQKIEELEDKIKAKEKEGEGEKEEEKVEDKDKGKDNEKDKDKDKDRNKNSDKEVVKQMEKRLEDVKELNKEAEKLIDKLQGLNEEIDELVEQMNAANQTLDQLTAQL